MHESRWAPERKSIISAVNPRDQTPRVSALTGNTVRLRRIKLSSTTPLFHTDQVPQSVRSSATVFGIVLEMRCASSRLDEPEF